ncbi:MAG TPA: hypothetical protein VEH31_36055 [Streptosporangiaceae bacterium]|nr:hypothetical protein [Streptosporangiaceae bacterium]
MQATAIAGPARPGRAPGRPGGAPAGGPPVTPGRWRQELPAAAPAAPAAPVTETGVDPGWPWPVADHSARPPPGSGLAVGGPAGLNRLL